MTRIVLLTVALLAMFTVNAIGGGGGCPPGGGVRSVTGKVVRRAAPPETQHPGLGNALVWITTGPDGGVPVTGPSGAALSAPAGAVASAFSSSEGAATGCFSLNLSTDLNPAYYVHVYYGEPGQTYSYHSAQAFEVAPYDGTPVHVFYPSAEADVMVN